MPQDASMDSPATDADADDGACAAGAFCILGGNTCQTASTTCVDGVQTCGTPVDISTGTACGTTNQACNAGTCVTIAAPRPVAPLSTALATSQMPTFHWALATGTTGAQVDICSTRACGTVLQTFTATGVTGAPSTALARGVYFWRSRGMIGTTVGTTTSPVWELRVGARSASVNASWGTVVDANGDGLADLVVGAGGATSSAGAAYVYVSTGAAGLSTSPTPLTPTGGAFGSSAASAGDVNGDGYADVVVGAFALNGNVGAVYVYFGGAGGISTSPDVTITGPGGANGSFGIASASAGDVNGDGYADIIVGASALNSGQGAAYVYPGGPAGTSTTPFTTVMTGPAASSNFGFSVASAGDVNGDGYGDVVVGANGVSSSTGAVYVYLGGVDGIGTLTTLSGPVTGGNFGISTWSADDVNGDGYADVVVGARAANSNVGAAYVYLGGNTGLSTSPLPALAGPAGTTGQFGSAVSGAGDVNGDGYGDVVIGAIIGGTAYVYFGGAALSAPTAISNPSPPASGVGWFGCAVAGVGDVNGDGLGDIAVGAQLNDTGAGAAYVYDGVLGSVSTTPTTSLLGPAGTNGGFGKPVE